MLKHIWQFGVKELMSFLLTKSIMAFPKTPRHYVPFHCTSGHGAPL
jgi:hypothetical protein